MSRYRTTVTKVFSFLQTSSHIRDNYNCIMSINSMNGFPKRGIMLSGLARQAAADVNAEFERAKERLNTVTTEPTVDVKLELYGLFKQATVGKCNVPKPGMMDFAGKAKWDAWNKLADLTQDIAKRKYVSVVERLAGPDVQSLGISISPTPTSGGEGSAEGDIETKIEDNIHIIRLNRPAKRNAITVKMYTDIANALNKAGSDNTTLAVLTGAGSYYSSGNDLTNFTNVDPSNLAGYAKDAGQLLKRFVDAFIDFPKPLIALVNGPAVGISVTTLALCDVVYAVDAATFHTPFSALGQTPEGCSSYLFPRIMGRSKANDMMMFNKKIGAMQAQECGLVSEIFPGNVFEKEAWTRVRALSKLPKKTLRLTKSLLRDVERDTLHSVNDRECLQLVERWQSNECMEAIMKFFQQKSNL